MTNRTISSDLLQEALHWYDENASYKLSPTGGGSRKANAIDHVPKWVPMARQFFAEKRRLDLERKQKKRNAASPSRPSVRHGGSIA